MLHSEFFDHDACLLAQQLLGKILYRRYHGLWLSAQIIETEAYYKHEKGSHASLGYTDKRKALFMPAGTIYMYYARGKDSLNISSNGDGNAVLIKSAFPHLDQSEDSGMLKTMQALNKTNSGENRPIEKLCSGQTLLCRSLNLKVTEWDQQVFNRQQFYIEDVGYNPEKILQTTRLGIPVGRDEHLPYRFIDQEYVQFCTSNPLTKRKNIPPVTIIEQ